MRYEIERTVLKNTGGQVAGSRGRGVERFVEAGENADDALDRFLSRDRSVLTGDLVTIGHESVGTARNDEGLFLLRLHVLEDRS
jgi:hypothetical protein